ncbi:NHL repeat-containing protein [Granulicella tundricola]|nr:NHL repeat-containing protein [Granulicella tundricola]
MRCSSRKHAMILSCGWLGIAAATIGCGSSTPSSTTTVTAPGSAFTGHITAAGQPVIGASVQLYAAGTSGNGTGAVNLLPGQTISSNSAGQFSIPQDFACPTSTTQTYLVAQSGNPGLAGGTDNRALLLVAALGDCGSLSITTTPIVNEATTAAAAWAFSTFLGASAAIGSSATNATGLRNAFALAANLVSISTGTIPGPNLPSSAKFETAKLNTLANALASCTHSEGGAACGPLFAAAQQGTTKPATTLDAALSIVRNPANNVTAVFAASSGQTTFQPTLASAPHDWTLSITYGNCTSGCGGLNLPGNIAIDSTGAVWVANYFGRVASKFSATGVAAATNGFVGTGLYASYGIAVDASDNAWVTNLQSFTPTNSYSGSVSEFSPAGAELSGLGYTGGGVYYPLAVAAGTNGDIWVADYGSSSASLLASNGTTLSGASGYAASQLPFTSAVALDATQNAWFAVQNGVARVTPLGAVTSFSCCDDPEGIAVDPSGDIWVADYGASSLIELSPSGQTMATLDTASAGASPKGIAIDGAGNVWAANYYGNSLTALTGSNAAFRFPTRTIGLDASLNEPYAIAVDASGNLWVSNSNSNALVEFIGLASPVKTPLLGPPAQP